jgi:CheY-like chemotaxis protein
MTNQTCDDPRYSATPGVSLTILIADDDDEDRSLAERAIKAAQIGNDVRFVEDGEELMAYLRQVGRYAAPGAAPRPGILLLDLKMPRKDGFAALGEIRADPSLRGLPIVVLTTSRIEEDVYRTYELGVNSFITKPVTFSGLVDAMRTLGRYWFGIVALPTAMRAPLAIVRP